MPMLIQRAGPPGRVVTGAFAPLDPAHQRRTPDLRRRSGVGGGLTVVGLAGFEPTTSSSRTRRATKLRYSPLPAPRGRTEMAG